MNNIVDDSSKFKLLSGNIFNALISKEDKINRLSTKMKNQKEIPEDEYNFMRASGTQHGILYGLPKIYKIGTPLRPFLSAIGTAGYNISKFFVPILAPFTSNEYTINDSFSFVEEILAIPNANSFVMASFDIKSLFTNIPLEETIDIASQNYQHRFFTHKFFEGLLSLSVKDILFLFNNQLFSQVDVVGMGNPLDPTFANLFLCHHGTNWLNNCPLHFKPKLDRRYVDDTFLLFSDPSHIPLFLNYLNSQHTNIIFTNEKETNNSLTFWMF